MMIRREQIACNGKPSLCSVFDGNAWSALLEENPDIHYQRLRGKITLSDFATIGIPNADTWGPNSLRRGEKEASKGSVLLIDITSNTL